MNSEVKVAVVTGAARGIGYKTAVQLAKDGYDIAIMDVTDEDSFKENSNAIRMLNRSVLYFKGNLADRHDREGFVQEVIKEYGKIDVLVNNAGVAPKERLDIIETTEESYDFVMDINLKGTFFLTQAVAKEMIKSVAFDSSRQPIIINVSSISEYTSSPNRGEYCLSKAGIGMLTKLFADRLAAEGILVYGIRPGIIMTDMTKTVTSKYDRLIQEGLLPIKRWGTPQDIADAVSLLCSGRLGYSAGQVLDIDGGFHLRRL